MKKYKVKKGNVGGYGGKTFKIGDTVTEANFPPNNARELCKAGFLEEEKAAPKKSVAPKKEVKKND